MDKGKPKDESLYDKRIPPRHWKNKKLYKQDGKKLQRIIISLNNQRPAP